MQEDRGDQADAVDFDKEAVHEKEEFLQGVTDVLLWKRPLLTVLMLASATLSYYHLVFRYPGIVSLVADVLLILTCAAGVVKVVAKQFDISLQDVPPYEVSETTSVCIVASIVNTLGAAEGVLRGAANGQDWKLYGKVCVSLYIASIVGRAASGATVLFLGTWLLFLLPPLFRLLPLPELAKEMDLAEPPPGQTYEDVEDVLLPALSRITTPRPSLQ
ncbi:hypothetical protein KFL_005700010 [Klebsormidium nitens]|uniref:Reticulon-like protein n=1 Tax=Klebsormidium nitens TaxID=105231 RepID=A0A1Y1IG79_KLENI|nr:hypothetical protein KFL_005700010 [Klebsormidium nitens]|eukprot:GAQ89860.1 hypothetical protein KFL_005700010 [Klebsormidium nitens]